MSTKWRRSKKNLKRSSFKNLDENKVKDHLRIPHLNTFNGAKTVFSPNYRSSQFYNKKKWKSPSPLIDIFQEKDWITLIIEITGFNKETFKIHVKDQKLTLSAKGNNQRYYKSLNLPKVVIPNEMSTKYNNGVLQIKLRKAKEVKS